MSGVLEKYNVKKEVKKMAYYLMLLVVLLIIYKLRKRIGGFFVVGIVLVVSIGLALFLSDWYLGGVYRGKPFTDPVIEEYDEFVEDPKGKVEEVAGGVREDLERRNQDLIEEGNRIDEKYGFEKGEDKVWVKKEESDNLEDNETRKTEMWETEKGRETTEKFEEENPDFTVENGTVKIDYNKVEEYIQRAGIQGEEAEYLRSVSPFNQGTYRVGRMEIEATKDNILITIKEGW